MIRLIILMLVLCMSPTAYAVGLQTYFAKVLLENLNLGGTYSTQNLANLPLAVKNTGEEEVNLKIDTIIPEQNELDEGYEAIPETSWVTFEKNTFYSIKSQEMAVTDVIITIPNDKKYQGKKFAAFIWSHTFVDQGIGLGVGLKSKLLFTINKEAPREETEDRSQKSEDRDRRQKSEIREMKIENQTGEKMLLEPDTSPLIPRQRGTNQTGEGMSVEPATLLLRNVPIGKIYELKDKLRIFNNTNATQTYTLKPIKPSTIGAKWQEGYDEMPEPAWFFFEKEEVEIIANGSDEIKMFLKIPDEDKYYNQHWIFSLAVTSVPKSGEFVALALYPRYLIETEDERIKR